MYVDLFVMLLDWEGVIVYVKYGVFWVVDEMFKYEFEVGFYLGNVGDLLLYYNVLYFSIMDRDNDNRREGNCVVKSVGVWWYNSCYDFNLNG